MSFRAVFIFVLLFGPVAASAEWTSYASIKMIKAESEGVQVVLDGFSNTSEEVQCERESFFMRPASDNYEAKLSFLLAAYSAALDVKLSYYGCDRSGLIGLSSVMLSR